MNEKAKEEEERLYLQGGLFRYGLKPVFPNTQHEKSRFGTGIRVGRSISQGLGRGHADCLFVGAHCALRSAQLRRGDSPDAVVLAVQEAQAQVGVAGGADGRWGKVPK